MSNIAYELGLPVGGAVAGWNPPAPPSTTTMQGAYCRLERLEPRVCVNELYEAFSRDADGRNWLYMPYGPFSSFAEFKQWLEQISVTIDPLFFGIFDMSSNKAVGLASFLRIVPAQGVVELGHLNFSPLLQRTRAATEAMFLMMERVFEQGYRRYEWKCDSLNNASRKAAQRLGFSYEGTFRKACMYKGRSRDTSWYSVIDEEWPALKVAYLQWLAPSNFDDKGVQIQSLSELTRPLLKRWVVL